MIEGSLSRRYSKALLELARESRQEESNGDELERFFSTLTESPLGAVLGNPGFGLDSRKKILLEVANNLQLSSVMEHFLALLLDRDRFAQGVPHDWFTYLRKNAPVYKHPEPDGPGFWVVTKYDDAAKGYITFKESA